MNLSLIIVEYSLHPIIRSFILNFPKTGNNITAHSILKALKKTDFDLEGMEKTGASLLSNDVLRNACIIAKSLDTNLLCSIQSETEEVLYLHIYEQHKKPYAMLECKRVGVEEGMSKGPQTIEKAKQGAYVARVVLPVYPTLKNGRFFATDFYFGHLGTSQFKKQFS